MIQAKFFGVVHLSPSVKCINKVIFPEVIRKLNGIPEIGAIIGPIAKTERPEVTIIKALPSQLDSELGNRPYLYIGFVEFQAVLIRVILTSKDRVVESFLGYRVVPGICLVSPKRESHLFRWCVVCASSHSSKIYAIVFLPGRDIFAIPSTVEIIQRFIPECQIGTKGELFLGPAFPGCIDKDHFRAKGRTAHPNSRGQGHYPYQNKP